MKLRAALVSALLLLPLSASAFTLQKDDQSFSFTQRNDAYKFGSNVQLEAPVTGDVVAAGDTVTIDEPVSGNVIAAGNTVILNTTINGNVKVAGSTVIIRGIVKGSVLAAGGNVTLQQGATVQGDLTMLGGTVALDGTVNGSALVRGQAVAMNGAIGGDADVRAGGTNISGSVNGNAVLLADHALTVDPKAKIGGNLKYWSEAGEQTFGSAVKGTATYDDTLQRHPDQNDDMKHPAAFLALLAGAIGLYAILSAALVLLFILSLMSKTTIDAAKYLEKNPWQSVGGGLVFFFGLPLVALLLVCTVIGIPLAVIVMFKFIAGLILARVIASVVLVRYWESRRKAKWNPLLVGVLSLLCYIVLHLLNVIPFIGWIVSTVAVLLGFGAFILTMWTKLKKVL